MEREIFRPSFSALPDEGERNVGPMRKRSKEIIMKSIRSCTVLKLAVGAIVAMSFNSQRAAAQDLAGKFQLPYAAHWGLSTLAAGDYSFTVQRTAVGATVHVYRGAMSVAYLVNQGYDMRSSEGLSLVVVRNRQGNFVRDLNLPEIGLVLHYAPSIRDSAAEREARIARIPVKGGSQ
jgi:hypothetical protein